MNRDECFLLGHVIKRHGLKGEVSIFLDVDDPNQYSELESVFILMDGKLIPFFINSLSLKGNKAVVHFEDLDTVEQADEIKGKELYLPLSVLPELEGTQFYYHEVVGFTVLDEYKRELGEVKDIYSSTAQELLAIDRNGKEILVPIVDQTILNVDREQKCIEVHLPEGLLDIYND